MYSFTNDYSEGTHPAILQALTASNMEQTSGYGTDCYTQQAIEAIQQKIKAPNAQIHLLVGGTQTNAIAISSFLRPHEAAICCSNGHINVHETGAIEATGHKVLTRPSTDGKLTVAMIDSILKEHIDEHMVKPKLVYISNSTELGTIYQLQELEELSAYCKAHQLIFYLDGARLGSGLCSEINDVTMEDIARLTDAFYIGGTKNGALFGEALVIVNPTLQEDFRYFIKQKGALLAKGRLLGIQFLELFKDDLFDQIATHANTCAMKLRAGIKELGYPFFVDSYTNQQFPILPDEVLAQLEHEFSYTFWEKVDENHTAIRLVTSFATQEDKVDEFLTLLRKLK